MFNVLFQAWGYITFLYGKDELVFWTLMFLILYTYVTYRLWRESVNQTNLNLMPIPAFYFRGESTSGKLRVRNLGNKPLFNLEIEDWVMIIHHRGRKPDVWKLKYDVPFPNTLTADEERDLRLKTLKNNVISSGEIWPHLHPEFNTQQIVPMRVKFQDARGIKYTAKFSMGKGGLAMIKPPKTRKIYSFITIDFFDFITDKLENLWFLIKKLLGIVKLN